MLIDRIRDQFPLTKNFIYLDNGATSLKPLCSINRLENDLKNSSTKYDIDKAHEYISKFFNSPITYLTQGTTQGLNMIARTIKLNQGDEIILSEMEHHANIVPWQELCKRSGAVLKVIPLNMDGTLSVEKYLNLISPKTKVVSIIHISNVLGSLSPHERILEEARRVGALTILDGAQSAPHQRIDFQKLNCDFFLCSAHKLYGPTGLGIVCSREKIDLSAIEIPPYYITSFQESLRFLNANREFIEDQERELMEYFASKINNNINLLGNISDKAIPLYSFTLKGIHPHDVATILGEGKICVRAGHMCAQPLINFFGISAASRASLSFYNTKREIDALFEGIERVKGTFG